jgi:hypothetical protein
MSKKQNGVIPPIRYLRRNNYWGLMRFDFEG